MTTQTLQNSARDSLVAMARAGNAWGFLTHYFNDDALAADPGLTLLAVSLLCKLGLRTCASETLERLPEAARSLPDVLQLRALVERLAPDEAPDPAATLRTNRAALGDRWIGAPAASLQGGACFRAGDGNVVLRWNGRWQFAGDQRALAGRALSEQRTLWVENPHAALVIAGLRSPWLLQRASEARKRDALGYRAPLLMIEPDEEAASAALSMADLSSDLADGHIRLFVGADAVQDFRRHQLERSHLRLSGTLAADPGAEPTLVQSVGAAFADAIRFQDETTRSLMSRVHALYASRDAAWWRERFADSSRPLRVLIPTSRYSTFVQHSSRDIARGLEALGHRAEVLIEPDGSSCLASGAYLDAILSLEPDLVICINYPRLSIGDFLPRNLPWVCWIQDQMPHLFDERLGRSLGVLDFTVGHVAKALHERYGYPIERAALLPVPASEAKFYSSPACPTSRSRFECEIAYVSHQSEHPDAQHARLTRELRATEPGERLARVLEPLREAIRRHLSLPLSTLPFPDLRSVVHSTLTATLGGTASQETVDSLTMGYAQPVADRLMRHETLTWAAEAARRNGWRLHLYGKGWENHPALREFAKGPLAHDGDLRLSYQYAGCHLQVTYHTLGHPRLCECVLSGGLPLCRFHWGERSMIETTLFRKGWHEGAEFRDGRAGEDVRRAPWTDAPALMRLASVMQSIGCFDDAIGADDVGDCVGYAPGALRGARWGAPFHPRLVPDRRPPEPLACSFAFEMVGEQPELFFHTAATLESKVRDLLNSGDRRPRINAVARKTIEMRHTYRAAADRILSLIRRSLAGSPAEASAP